VSKHPRACRNPNGLALSRSKEHRVNIAAAGASIIDLRAYVDPSRVPTLVLLDLQQEYVATSRALAVPGAAAALANCRKALAHARAKGFPVAFVRWLARAAFFNPATRFSRWIEGFEPFGSDMVFERDQPSCYASTSFDQVMTECGGNFVLAGFAGEAACLATTVDAFNRGHRLTFLADASASHALEEVAAGDVHRIVSKVIGVYGETILTRNWIAATSRKPTWREPSDANGQDRTA
jgi:nicotinamidase-related amidase